MEELERERTRQNHGKIVRDPEKVHALESLRLARTELDRQLTATTHERRRAQLNAGDRRGRSPHEGNRSDDEVTEPRRDRARSRYHDGTKHHFHRFARSLGYLDWASQPNPFRSFAGAPVVSAAARGRTPSLASATRNPQSRDRRRRPAPRARPLGVETVRRRRAGRCASTRRAATSIPTEAYVVAGPTRRASATTPGVYHYAPDRHALEQRCAFDAAAWPAAVADPDSWLIALTSIHWREAWKYGERAFRYCQHDMGHAIAAVRIAAALAGWRATLLPEWSHADIAALTGIDRDEDYVEAEREEAGCCHGRSAFDVRRSSFQRSTVRSFASLLAGVRAGQWTGRASQLSEDHATWTFIDEIAAATRDPGRRCPANPADPANPITALTRSRRSARSRLWSCSAAAPCRFDGAIVDRRRDVPRDAVARDAATGGRRGTRCGGRADSPRALRASRRRRRPRALPAGARSVGRRSAEGGVRPRVSVGAGRRCRCRSSASRAATAGALARVVSAAIRTSRRTASSASA